MGEEGPREVLSRPGGGLGFRCCRVVLANEGEGKGSRARGSSGEGSFARSRKHHVSHRTLCRLTGWLAGSVCSPRSMTLFGGCAGGGAALRGCPGLLLLSPHGQAAWVALEPRGQEEAAPHPPSEAMSRAMADDVFRSGGGRKDSSLTFGGDVGRGPGSAQEKARAVLLEVRPAPRAGFCGDVRAFSLVARVVRLRGCP